MHRVNYLILAIFPVFVLLLSAFETEPTQPAINATEISTSIKFIDQRPEKPLSVKVKPLPDARCKVNLADSVMSKTLP